MSWCSLAATRMSCGSLLLGALLAGCGSDKETVYNDKTVEHVVDGSTGEQFVSNIIAPPADADSQFLAPEAPVVEGITSKEQVPTVISDLQQYKVNDSLRIIEGKLNHTYNEALIVADFKLGEGLSLEPLERSRGQFSMERTTQSADKAIDQGRNIVLAVNADPYDMVNGWNMGLTKMDGVTYTGFSDRVEEVVVVYEDGRADILAANQVPDFTLRLYVAGKLAGEVGSVYRYDASQQKNAAYVRGSSDVAVYVAENYRGPVNLKGKTGVLVRPQANGVTVLAQPDGSSSVQFVPFSGQAVGVVQDDAAYVIPAGHALVVGAEIPASSQVDVRYETDNADWAKVRYAVGSGFGRGLLVENGELAGDADEGEISSRTGFGIRADGSAFFLVADKPVGSTGDGITRTKLAQLMRAYGAVKAINFDGGGSSTLVGRFPGDRYTHLLNQPSDGTERSVATKWALVLDPDKARYEDSVTLHPRELTLLAGSTFRRFRGVGFDARQWERDGIQVEYGISDAGLGLIDKVTGAFKAGGQQAEGYVVARAGDKKGVARVNVVSSIDTIAFPRNVYTLDSGATLALKPVLTSGGRSVSYESGVLKYTVDNAADCAINASTGVLTAGAVQGRSCQVTVSYGDQSATVKVDIGVPPVIVDDFEGDVSMYAGSGARHKAVTLERVSDPVFAGEYSMRLSWETDPKSPGTFGAYVTDPGKVKTLPGYPKYLGVNVYIPDELAGKVWWVRGLLVDADNKQITINYNNDGEGLPERGWNFMMAEIPEGYREPLRFSQPFRFLVLKTAERIDSHVLLDNFTAVYSDNTDLQGPGVVVTPASGETVDSHSPRISLQLADASGVDFNNFELKLDGQDISAKTSSNGTDRLEYQASGLADGWHRLDYRVLDINGNVSAGDLMFNVVTGAPRIHIESNNVEFYPGGTFDLPIRVVGAANFSEMVLHLSYDATKTSLELLPADLTPSQVSTGSGTLKATFNGFKDNTQTIATLRLKVKDYIQNTDISVTAAAEVDGKTWYHPVIRKPVGGRYTLMTHWGVGGQATELLVVGADGKPARGVTIESLVYNSANDTVTEVRILGVTDEHGMLRVQLPAGTSSQDLIFRVYDSVGSSLMTKVQALVERLDAAPRHVYLTPAASPSELNVTWYTALGSQASVVHYGDTEALSQSATGNSEILPFFYGAESGAVRVHHAKLTGLKPGKTYHYSVGDGAGSMSPVYTVLTDNGDDQVDIVLFGDTQTAANENIFDGNGLVRDLYKKMMAQLPGSELILHVGDFTDDLSDYRLVRLFFDALEGEGALASKVFVPAQGNHEVINEGASKFASMFRLPMAAGSSAAPFDSANYSFDYGNAHIAVVSTEMLEEADWTTMTQWLEADMKASAKTWKILMLHRPPYNGNPASGNGRSAKYIPPVVDAAGIDLVISGHDHMYSRSVPLVGGVPRLGGATYLIAGSDSAKYYDNDGNGIARVADVLFDDNVNTYTTLSIRGDRMHVLTKTLAGQVVDDVILQPRATVAR
ncbi:calcineurin-like phosphoesterase family protein [Kerstersia gyiorum]|uniref:Calcineurin-like phosphoesterase family protein n=2 Tax=Kerstersia gyiorum TaxID=206506 RepID=A0A4Q7MMN2_9BURK|nr:calcineurin-like phosphoesterase family protein [Kerstersia gyiorum]